MPPELNIYGITKHRDKSTIKRLIDKYVDQIESENRGDEELMMRPLAAFEKPLDLDDYEWEPALTLTHTVERGLDYPRRAFTVYLASKDTRIDQVILSFTTDNQLVVGLAIDDEDMSPANEQQAKRLLEELMQDMQCHLGLIIAEFHPPANQFEFLSQSSSPFTLFFTASESSSQSD